MSDTTWRDDYGDAEGLASVLDSELQSEEVRHGHYALGTTLSSAATALREQAARIAELEALLTTPEQEPTNEQ